MSEMIACLLGIFTAIREPLKIPITMMCQNETTPVMSKVPMIMVSKAFEAWLKTTSFFLENLSAKAPAKGDTTVMGNANVRVTRVSARGESSVTLRMSQLLVIICIFIAKNETNELIHIQRKSL